MAPADLGNPPTTGREDQSEAPTMGDAGGPVRCRIVKSWLMREWNELPEGERPAGAVPFGLGWMLLEVLPPTPGPPIGPGPPDRPAGEGAGRPGEKAAGV